MKNSKKSVLLETPPELETEATSNFVDSVQSLTAFIDDLLDPEVPPQRLYIDLEGQKLSRTGSISTVTILVYPRNHIYLIDVYAMKETVFTTTGKNEMTLKKILQSPEFSKIFFDLRNDSDALFFHFNVSLQGAEDVQLMELAARKTDKRLLHGLAACIERDAQLSFSQRQAWKVTKDVGRKLFDPLLGGSYQVFDARPLAKAVKDYCVQDVQYLPILHEMYWNRLEQAWRGRVKTETEARIRESQQASYQPHGRHKVLGPWKSGNIPNTSDTCEDANAMNEDSFRKWIDDAVEADERIVEINNDEIQEE